MQYQEALHLMGLSPGYSEADVTAKYRHLARKHHPDAGGSDEGFKRLHQARQILCDHLGYAHTPHHEYTKDAAQQPQAPVMQMQDYLILMSLGLLAIATVLLMFEFGVLPIPNFGGISGWLAANKAEILGALFILMFFWSINPDGGFKWLLGVAFCIFAIPAAIYYFGFVPLTAQVQPVINHLDTAVSAFDTLARVLQ